jgi:hypothetical protein
MRGHNVVSTSVSNLADRGGITFGNQIANSKIPASLSTLARRVERIS